MNHIAIIYHDADFDGKLSNEVCRHWLKNSYPEAAIHSYGWDYGRPVPSPSAEIDTAFSHNGGLQTRLLTWEDYDQIYIVDLSVDELMARLDLRDKIVWIDHHKTAIDKWDATPSDAEPEPGRFQGYRIDGVAACRLCWQWFSYGPNFGDPRPIKTDFIERRVAEPELIRLAGEYDIWDHRDPDAKALQFGLRSLSDKDYRILVESQFSGEDGAGYGSTPFISAIASGYAIKAYCDKQNDEYSATYSHTLDWEGLKFCALNIGQRGNSDLVRGGLKPEHQAIFAWRYTGAHALVSLYHAPGHEDLDLSAIAKKYGGGGHRGACGFRLTLKELSNLLP